LTLNLRPAAGLLDSDRLADKTRRPRIEAIDDFAKISLGRGGFWEDRGYEWYAGI
jgi:hypothetical protein